MSTKIFIIMSSTTDDKDWIGIRQLTDLQSSPCESCTGLILLTAASRSSTRRCGRATQGEWRDLDGYGKTTQRPKGWAVLRIVQELHARLARDRKGGSALPRPPW